jgi:hypothetical protein
MLVVTDWSVLGALSDVDQEVASFGTVRYIL